MQPQRHGLCPGVLNLELIVSDRGVEDPSFGRVYDGVFGWVERDDVLDFVVCGADDGAEEFGIL